MSTTTRALFEAAEEDDALEARAPDDELAGIEPVGVERDMAVRGAAERGAAAFAPEANVDDERLPSTLTELARVGRALALLHERGRVHGELGPQMVARDDDGLRLRVCRRRLDAAALLGARLAEGAAAVDVAYAAPEVVSGRPASFASDVYSLAALAFLALAGRPPLGHLVVGKAARGDLELTRALARALDAEPEARPSAAELARAFATAAARDRAAAEAAPSTSARPRFGVDADPSAFTERPFGTPSYAPSKQRTSEVSALLVIVLAVGGAFVVGGALWFGLKAWDGLSEWGRLLLLLALTAGLGVVGMALDRRGWQRSALALYVAFTQVLWGDAAYVIDTLHLDDEPPWIGASTIVFAATLAVASWKRSALLGSIAALDLAVLAGALGSYLSTGSATGPATYTLLVALAYLVVAYGGHAIAGRAISVPHAAGAALGLLLSAALGYVGLADQTEPRWFFPLWPYLALGVGAALAWRLPKPFRVPFAVPALVLALLPTLEALPERVASGFMYFAAATGIALVLFGLLAAPDDERGQAEGGLVVLGLVHCCTAPTWFALRHCGGERFLDCSLEHLGVALGIALGLCVAGVQLSARAGRKSSYRLVEGAGAAMYFYLLTWLSLGARDDLVYPGLVLAGGAALLVTALGLERLVLALASGAALVVNLWIQYFQKLERFVPMSLLLVGFGLGLLALGALFERKVRRAWPTLREWA